MIPFNRRQTTAQSQRNSINFNDYLDDKQLFVPGSDYNADDPYYQLPINKFDPSAVAGAKYGLGYAPPEQTPIAPQSSVPQAPINRRPPAPKPPDIDYPSAYAKIIDKQNRPNRLEYERMVKEGAPQIPQSRWARLGAALAGGGVTWATGDSARGYNLGMSALEGPQKRSDEAYDRKLKGFGELAQSEERDMSERIKALEFQSNDFYNREANRRADNADSRADRMTDAQLEDLALGNLRVVEKVQDGHSYLYDPKTKQYVADLGQTKWTPEQITANAVAEFKAKEDAKVPYDINAEQRALTNQKSLIEIKDKNTQRLQDDRQDAAAKLVLQRMQGQLNKMSPGDRYKDSYLKIMAAIENDPELAGTDYIVQDPNTGMVSVKPVHMWDSDETAAKKDKLNKLVAAGLDVAANPPTASGATSTAPGTVKLRDPQGKEFDAPEDQVADILKDDPRITRVNPASPTVTAPTAPAAVAPAPAPIVRPQLTGPPLPRNGVTPAATAAKFGVMPPPMFGAGVNPSMPAPVAPPRNINNFLPAPPPTATPAGNIPPPNAPVAAPPISAAPTVAPPSEPIIPVRRKASTPGSQPVRGIPPPVNPITLSAYAQAEQQPNPGQFAIPQRPDIQNNLPPPPPQQVAPPPNPIQLGVPPPNVPPAPPPQVPMGVAPRQAPTNPLLRAQLQGLATPPVTPPQQAPSSPLLNSPILPPQPSPGRVADAAPANPITLSNNRGAGIYKNDLVNEDMGEPPVSTAPPSGAKVFDQKFETVRAKLREATGIDIKAISKVRTEEQQKKLYAQGRGKGDKRPVITELDGVTKKSKHQTGEAADIAFVDKRGKTIKPNDKLWNTFGRLAREEGLIWGGDWKSLVDKGHIQLGEVGQQ